MINFNVSKNMNINNNEVSIIYRHFTGSYNTVTISVKHEDTCTMSYKISLSRLDHFCW